MSCNHCQCNSCCDCQPMRGPRGIPGARGFPGFDGQPGRDGIDGTNGVDGINGTNGVNGMNGTNGVDGAKGDKGDPGIPGPSWASQVVLASDVTNSTTALENVTGLSFPVLANKTYNFKALIRIDTSALGNFFRVVLNSAGTLDFLSAQQLFTGGTNLGASSGQALQANNFLLPSVLSNTSLAFLEDNLLIFEGLIRLTTDSIVQFQFASEAASPSFITIKEGSVVFYKQLD